MGSQVGRQSLVTPIDWKQVGCPVVGLAQHGGRQSLVTPIDWKILGVAVVSAWLAGGSPILGDAY